MSSEGVLFCSSPKQLKARKSGPNFRPLVCIAIIEMRKGKAKHLPMILGNGLSVY